MGSSHPPAISHLVAPSECERKVCLPRVYRPSGESPLNDSGPL